MSSSFQGGCGTACRQSSARGMQRAHRAALMVTGDDEWPTPPTSYSPSRASPCRTVEHPACAKCRQPACRRCSWKDRAKSVAGGEGGSSGVRSSESLGGSLFDCAAKTYKNRSLGPVARRSHGRSAVRSLVTCSCYSCTLTKINNIDERSSAPRPSPTELVRVSMSDSRAFLFYYRDSID